MNRVRILLQVSAFSIQSYWRAPRRAGPFRKLFWKSMSCCYSILLFCMGNSASQLNVSTSVQLWPQVTDSICIPGRWKRIHKYFSASWLLAQDALELHFLLTIFSFFIRAIAFSVVYSSAKQLWYFLSLSSIACARKNLCLSLYER